MTTFILQLFYRFSKVLQQRYPDGPDNPYSAEDAIYHVNFYLTIGLFSTALAAIPLTLTKWSLLALLAIPVLALQAVHKELIIDGHLKRIRDKTETPEGLLDMKADLITRFAGLALPALLVPIILYFGLLLQ